MRGSVDSVQATPGRRAALRRAVVVVPAWFVVGVVLSPAAPVVLVDQGRPVAAIVPAERPSAAAKVAAEHLRHWIEAVSGARLPIADPGDRRAAVSPRIVVGSGATAASLGVDTEGLGPEGIRLRTVGSDLVVLGVDGSEAPGKGRLELNGTFYAAMTFVERYLGVRWLWPGPLGTVVPHRATVVVPETDLSFTPRLAMRRYRSRNVWSGPGRIARVWGPDAQGAAGDRGRQMASQSGLWLLRHKLQGSPDNAGEEGEPGVAGLARGGSVTLHYGHAFGDWYERYGKEHPDWFALQPDGSRVQPGPADRSRFCVSNEGLVAEIIRRGREFLDADPEAGSYNVCPNDGGPAKFCCCERCVALDVPGTGTTGRYMWLFNRVAEALAETHPGRLVCSYAYSTYKTPFPALRMRDNVVLGLVMFGSAGWLCDAARAESRAQWSGWNGRVRHRFLRPNISSGGGGLPLLYPRRMAEDLKPIFREGILGVDFDSVGQHWATEGLDYYVLAKLIWDGDCDVDAIVDDYCRAGFGPAAPAVRRYFDRLEGLTSEVARSVPIESIRTLVWPWRLPEVRAAYSAGTLAALADILAEAGRLAAGAPADVGRRVEFLRDGLRFAELVMDLDKTDAEAIRARQRYCREHRFSWVVTAAYRGGGLQALRSAGLEELPAEARGSVSGIPILWRNPRGDGDVSAIGWRRAAGMHWFVFLMRDDDTAARAGFGVYLDADGDRSTGRENLGNDYYLSPGKGSAIHYGKDRRSATVPLDFCFWYDRAVLIGIREGGSPGTPFAPGCALWVGSARGKTPRVKVDPSVPPLGWYSPAGD